MPTLVVQQHQSVARQHAFVQPPQIVDHLCPNERAMLRGNLLHTNVDPGHCVGRQRGDHAVHRVFDELPVSQSLITPHGDREPPESSTPAPRFMRRFNEAALKRGRKLGRQGHAARGRLPASMRPPSSEGGNSVALSSIFHPAKSFNEAALKRGRKPGSPSRPAPARHRLQ